MHTIRELLDTIDTLPADRRQECIDMLEEILELRQGPRELALGLLALDLADDAQVLRWRPRPADRVPALHPGERRAAVAAC